MSNFGKRLYTKEQLGGEAVNFIRFQLSANITATATTIPVKTDPTTILPSGANEVVYMSIGAVDIDEEVVRVISRDSTNIYVQRNADGRGAYAHNADDWIRYAWCAENYNHICDVLADVQAEMVASATCSVDIDAYKVVCYNSSGYFALAKANALDTSLIIGMTTAGFESGSTGYALRSGIITNALWNWNAQKRLWLSATNGGELQEYEPAIGNWSVCPAITKTANVIDFKTPDWGMIGQL